VRYGARYDLKQRTLLKAGGPKQSKPAEARQKDGARKRHREESPAKDNKNSIGIVIDTPDALIAKFDREFIKQLEQEVRATLDDVAKKQKAGIWTEMVTTQKDRSCPDWSDMDKVLTMVPQTVL